MHIEPHCIQSEANHTFKRLMDHCLVHDCSEEDMARLELLREFLTTADFAALRASSPLLRAEIKGTVIIRKTGDLFEITEKPGQ